MLKGGLLGLVILVQVNNIFLFRSILLLIGVRGEGSRTKNAHLLNFFFPANCKLCGLVVSKLDCCSGVKVFKFQSRHSLF